MKDGLTSESAEGTAEVADQHIKSITVLKQITRADGTVEPAQVAAYMDRDPDEMERVLRGEKLPDGAVGLVEEAAPVKGRCRSGRLVVDLLNDIPLADAERITRLNERTR